MDRHKLGIIVPYRHRQAQLENFLLHTKKYLSTYFNRYEIIVVDQDDAKQFNRGMLLNIGFIYAKKNRCDYVVFHDVDMLPVEVDYSFSETPLHLATDFELEYNEKKREIFDEYFGGVTMFTVDTFEKINGYSNKYWGWGYEDTDLLLRCVRNNIDLDTLQLKNRGKNQGKFLKLNGINSFIKCKNVIDFTSNITLSVTFYPNQLFLNHTKSSDEFTIFSVPGWDFAISYTSFSRYNFCIFDIHHEPMFLNSTIKTNYKTNIIITINVFDKWIKFYQDGILIGQINSFIRLHLYRKEPHFYLGVGDPLRKIIPNYFTGYFESFAYFDEILDEDEIIEIANNDVYLLRKDFGNYKSSDKLKCYYESSHTSKHYELLDLSGNENHAKIINCEIVEKTFDDYKYVSIPHRRKSKFKSMKHEENGFLGTGWKEEATRWNQLRFHNEVFPNTESTLDDGLSNLEFVEHGKSHKNNILCVNVGI